MKVKVTSGLYQYLIEYDEFKSILTKLLHLSASFCHLPSILPLGHCASVLHAPCCNFAHEVTFCTRWPSFGTFSLPYYENTLLRTNSNNPSMKGALSTYSPYILLPRTPLFHNASAYSVCNVPMVGWSTLYLPQDRRSRHLLGMSQGSSWWINRIMLLWPSFDSSAS